MESCCHCSEQFPSDEMTNRPDLIHPDDPSEPHSPICESCIPRCEEAAAHEFVCNECHLLFTGNRITMTAFGMFCSTCMDKEGFTIPTLTVPPKDGWSGKDVGRVVFIKGEHGVIIKDTIIMSSLRGPDIIVGPATYVAEIHQRLQSYHHMTNHNTYEEGLQHLMDSLHGFDDDDESEMIP